MNKAVELVKKCSIKRFCSITLIVAMCLTVFTAVPAFADESREAVCGNLQVNPEWEGGTDGWEVTVYNEESFEGSGRFNTVISQDVPLDGLSLKQDYTLKLSASLAVAPEDETQEYIQMELSFLDDSRQLTNISDTGPGTSLVKYEHNSALTYHDIVVDIPEKAAYARVSLSIWKGSRLNPMYFENLCLEAIEKTAPESSFHKSGGITDPGSQPEDDANADSEVPDEWDPEIIAAYEEWARDASDTYDGPDVSDLPEYKNEEIVSVSEDGFAEFSSGVKVDFSDSLDTGENPVLKISETAEVTDEEYGAAYKAYDITLGDIHELDGYIEIRIPYDESDIEAGQDPAGCVAGMYLNRETGQWEPALYEVDTQTQELIIHTNHLSEYGYFKFVNEGKRTARITSIYDTFMSAEPELYTAALKEVMENSGVPGTACKEVMRPHLEKFLTQYFEQSVTNTADIATKVGNVTGMLITVTPGAESFLNKNPLAYGLNEALGKAGLAISVVSLATQMFKEDKTDNEILSMYKDAMYLLASIGGTQEAILGTIGASVWVIDYAITDMGNYAYNKVKEDLSKAYRFYMTTDNKWHGKPRTEKDWRRILKKTAKNAIKDGEDAQHAIMEEIDDYCGAFWNMRDDDLAEVYDEVGLKGRGLPDAATKDAITDEFRGELMDSLQSVLMSVKNDLEWELMDEQEKRLEEVRRILNYVITFEVKENIPENKNDDEYDFYDDEDGEEVKAKYAGYTAVFAPLDDTAEADDWRFKLDEDGCGTTRVTFIGWLLAGQPAQMEFYSPQLKPGEDKAELSVKYELTVPKTLITIGGGDIDAFMGRWRYRLVEDNVEKGGQLYKRITTSIIDFSRNGYDITMVAEAPSTWLEGAAGSGPDGLQSMIDASIGDKTLMGTYEVIEDTGDFIFNVKSVRMARSLEQGYETTEVDQKLIFRLKDEDHLMIKMDGEDDFDPEIYERIKE